MILSVGLSVCLSVYLSVYLSVCLSVSLSVSLSVCLSVCLYYSYISLIQQYRGINIVSKMYRSGAGGSLEESDS